MGLHIQLCCYDYSVVFSVLSFYFFLMWLLFWLPLICLCILLLVMTPFLMWLCCSDYPSLICLCILLLVMTPFLMWLCCSDYSSLICLCILLLVMTPFLMWLCCSDYPSLICLCILLLVMTPFLKLILWSFMFSCFTMVSEVQIPY
jgi:hypothetical protein